jgi:lipoyl(octanoyl) transferase
LLGCIDWETVWSLQRRLVYETAGQSQPLVTLLCCEHPELITVGRSGSRAHIHLTDEELTRHRLMWRWVGRGGGCVYHAPGQLCLYPILSLERWGWSVGEYLRRLQRALCSTLQSLNIQPLLREGHFGVWGRSGLLAAVGVAVRGWVTCHGAYLNVNPSMGRLALVDAIPADSAGRGQKTAPSCLLAERRLPVRMTSVRAAVVQSFADSFSCDHHHIHSGHPLLAKRLELSREPVARAS